MTSDINGLSEELRDDWGVNNTNPIDISSLVLEKINNLTLLWLPLGDLVSGACSKNNNDILIIINSEHSKGRQNFTLAHEIYHILYDDIDTIICKNEQSNNDNEKRANNFASSFLLPPVALKRFIKKHNIEKWSLDDIIKCEQYFKISHHAMLVRLMQENLITTEEFDEFKGSIKAEAAKRGFSTELYEPSEKSRQYFSLGAFISLTEKAFLKNKISAGKKDELLLDMYRSDIVYNLNESDLFD